MDCWIKRSGSHAFSLQKFRKHISFSSFHKNINKPWRGLFEVGGDKSGSRNLLEQFLVPPVDLFFPPNPRFHFLQLLYSDHRLQVGKFEIEPHRFVVLDASKPAAQVQRQMKTAVFTRLPRR